MKLIVHDIETPKGCFLLSALFEDGSWKDLLINDRQNDLLDVVKFLKDNEDAHWIGYNCVNFDGQVLEYILRTYQKWVHLSGKEIAKLIYDFASDVIKDTNYGGFPPYREDQLSLMYIDVFKVQHFDNKNRRVGLKRLEYEMDMENIEEMNVPPDQEFFTDKEIEDLIYYCHNDVYATKLNYQYLIGETENEFYKGTDAIQLRLELTKTFGINCLNYSNSKYGDEIMKKLYADGMGIKIEELPKKGTFRKTLYFKSCIPDYIKFKTDNLNAFLKELKKIEIGVADSYEKELKIGNRRHTFALGGLHSITENEFHEEDEEYDLIDVDVSGYYVWTIISQLIAPRHLNTKAFLKTVRWLYEERLKLKPLVKTHPEYKSLVSGYKEAAVSLYGKMGDMTNWMYDPQARLHVCISGQLSILMLIETLELGGFHCFMSNTDGASFIVKKSKKDEFDRLCKEWCDLTTYELEFAKFKKIYFENVNSYIALKDDGSIKKKNTFLTSTELHKNKSFRVIPLALEAYFINNIEPETFINNFKDIYQFCGRSTGGNTYYHEAHQNSKSWKLPKLIRYYVAKDGYNIIKHVKEGNDTNANDTNVRPADGKKVVVNNLPKEIHEEHLKNVKREWYIQEVKKIIYRIQTGKKPKTGFTNENQLSLF